MPKCDILLFPDISLLLENVLWKVLINSLFFSYVETEYHLFLPYSSTSSFRFKAKNCDYNHHLVLHVWWHFDID
jgi:hypothetical protein